MGSIAHIIAFLKRESFPALDLKSIERNKKG